MHEMGKKQQVHEDARKMYRTKIFVGKFWKVEKATPGRPRFSKMCGQARRSSDMVQKVFGICEAKNGTEVNEVLQAGASGLQGVWQNVNADSGP